MTRKIVERIVKGITDKIEANTADMDDWAEFWGFTIDEYEDFLDRAIKVLEQEPCDELIQTIKGLDDMRMSALAKRDFNSVKILVDAIKALEEQPRIKVLDKIRAEIMQLEYDTECIDYDYNDMPQTEEVHMICREEVMKIIDKYKAESEE